MASYRFGRFELNPATRQLFADSGQVTLGGRAFDVLLALVERRDRLVTKEELLELAWPGLVVEENNLQVQISALRKALGLQAIATVPGRGYRFAARLDGDSLPVSDRLADAPERRKESRRWLEPSRSEGPRLAAVVFTDVVGYSSRMQANETATIALVSTDFERMRALCGQHGGESLNTMGDGLLLCFPSALQAVQCALQIQAEFGARKASLPAEQALEHRIGVHLGDVFRLETGDVAGDGINIAARLEAKAPAGGICLSQTVYDTVKGKIAMDATFIGPERFKNISHPIPIWHIAPLAGGRDPASSGKENAADAVQSSDSRSIAVLPFSNLSDDKDTGYFADGVHEDLLTQLALLGELKVVSRTSVMEYRETTKKIRQIAAELHVGAIVEGTVRRAGNQVRVTAQLIDPRSDKHLWAKSYDRELKDIFAIQSELATQIAKALNITLSPKAATRLAIRSTDNLEAYEFFLRAQELYNQSAGTIRSVSTIMDRIALLSKAVEVDPGFAHAWARLAEEHARVYFSVVDRTPERLAQAKSAIDRALTLAPDDLLVLIAEGDYFDMALRDSDRATQAYEKVLRAAPHNVAALNGLASVLWSQRRDADRIAVIERALAVDPRSPDTLRRVGGTYAAYRHYDRALECQRRLIELRPDDPSLKADWHRLEYFRTGDWVSYDEWRATLPRDAERRHQHVYVMDTDRAIARRDYAEVIRLAEFSPEDGRARVNSAQADLLKSTRLACAYRAAGERTRAIESARAGLGVAELAIRQNPRDWVSYYLKACLQAVIGEADLALTTYARAVSIAQQESGPYEEFRVKGYGLQLNALLGNHGKALDDAARQLALPHSNVHDYHVSIELCELWNHPTFKALLADPKSNAPLPIMNWELQVPRADA